jgi:hypothetical protein
MTYHRALYVYMSKQHENCSGTALGFQVGKSLRIGAPFGGLRVANVAYM